MVLASDLFRPEPVDLEIVAATLKTAPQQFKVTTVSSGPSHFKKPRKGQKAHLAKAKGSSAQKQTQDAPKTFSTGSSSAQPFSSNAGSQSGSHCLQNLGFASSKRGKRQ